MAWVLIYASTPLYMYYASVATQEQFNWSAVLREWNYTSGFLGIFLISHFLLIPKLINKKRVSLYVLSVLACIVGFILYLHIIAPHTHKHRTIRNETCDVENRHVPGHANMGDRTLDMSRMPMAEPPHHRWHLEDNIVHSPFLLAPPDLARVITMILMVLADLGAVAWFNGQRLRQRLLSLEQQTLKQELAQLRFQINPHFFMNTLNNIHALIDIDQERAKRSIVELSGMMRYALYEGNNSLTPLQHEIEFLRMYISLMKLRYSNKVDVHVDIPEKVPAEVMMPPMIFATFIENAFKHGVSYQKSSFIYITLALEDNDQTIRFCCSCQGQEPVRLDSEGKCRRRQGYRREPIGRRHPFRQG